MGANTPGKYFMTKLNLRIVSDQSMEPKASWLPVGHVSKWGTGCFLMCFEQIISALTQNIQLKTVCCGNVWGDTKNYCLTLLHSGWPKLDGVLTSLSVIGLFIPVSPSWLMQCWYYLRLVCNVSADWSDIELDPDTDDAEPNDCRVRVPSITSLLLVLLTLPLELGVGWAGTDLGTGGPMSGARWGCEDLEEAGGPMSVVRWGWEGLGIGWPISGRNWNRESEIRFKLPPFTNKNLFVELFSITKFWIPHSLKIDPKNA